MNLKRCYTGQYCSVLIKIHSPVDIAVQTFKSMINAIVDILFHQLILQHGDWHGQAPSLVVAHLIFGMVMFCPDNIKKGERDNPLQSTSILRSLLLMAVQPG